MSLFLVIDAHVATLRALTTLLRDDGHEVTALRSGGEALEALTARPFEIVVVDEEILDASTIEVVRTARASSPLACIVVSTARDTGQLETLREEGACLLVDKPMDYDALCRAVKSCRALGGCGAAGCHRHSRAGAELLTMGRTPRRL